MNVREVMSGEKVGGVRREGVPRNIRRRHRTKERRLMRGRLLFREITLRQPFRGFRVSLASLARPLPRWSHGLSASLISTVELATRHSDEISHDASKTNQSIAAAQRR